MPGVRAITWANRSCTMPILRPPLNRSGFLWPTPSPTFPFRVHRAFSLTPFVRVRSGICWCFPLSAHPFRHYPNHYSRSNKKPSAAFRQGGSCLLLFGSGDLFPFDLDTGEFRYPLGFLPGLLFFLGRAAIRAEVESLFAR